MGLSENEWYIMQALWEKSPSTLREICNALQSKKGWTKHAISSFLKRMEAKGAVRAEEGKLKKYYAVWNQEETIGEETHAVLERVYRGDLLLMVSNAVKQQELTKEEMDGLRQLLDTIE